MPEPEQIEFYIDAFTKETMPMARLAEYLKDLAVLLGHKASVHLIGVEGGSTRPQILIDAADVPKIRDRVNAVRMSDAPEDAMRAYRAIDDRLARDNAKGTLVSRTHSDNKIIEFPGRDRTQAIRPFSQPGVLDGVVMAVGGRDNPPTVHLQDESKTYVCHASRALIKQIAPYIYETPIRVSGNGRWERNLSGDWILARFTIHDFTPLKDTPLQSLVASIRSEKLSQWGEADAPLEELHKLRHGD